METVENIDAILAAEKRIIGIGRWAASRPTTVRIKIPLEIGGEVRGGLALDCNASLHATPQQGALVLIYGGAPIERMSFNPPSPHANPMHKSLPHAVRGLTLQALAHRYYPWRLNRRWPRPPGDNLAVAEAVEFPLDSFDAVIHYFCRRTNIVGDLPPPPHEPRLDLR